jgi:hypothetical protein
MAQSALIAMTAVVAVAGQAMDLFGPLAQVGQRILRYSPVLDKVVEQVTAYNLRQWVV